MVIIMLIFTFISANIILPDEVAAMFEVLHLLVFLV